MKYNIKEYKIKIYTSFNGKTPFIKWFQKLDKIIQYRIDSRLDRIKHGNFGDSKKISKGIYELRIFAKTGYRIYYSKEKDSIILLLIGGSKSTQEKDIKKAKLFLLDYKNEKLN